MGKAKAYANPQVGEAFMKRESKTVGKTSSILQEQQSDSAGRDFAEALIDTVREGLLVLTPDLHVQTANRLFYQKFEVSEAETIGTLVYELGNGQWDIPELRTLLEDILPEQNVFDDFEVTHSFEHIGKRTMMLNARQLETQQLILLAIEDISERREAEVVLRESEALRESEERYRTLFESIDEGYCTIEVLFDDKSKPFDWRFLEVNPAFEKNNGLTNATGKTVLETTPDIEPKWFDIYGAVALSGEPIRFEEHSAALGRHFDLYAFRVGEPKERKVAVLFTDITKRKEAEEALQELNKTLEQRIMERTQKLERSERRFFKIFHVGPFAAIIVKRESGEILDANESFGRLAGYSREDVIGKTTRELGLWASEEEQHKIRTAAQENDGYRELELSLKTKTGDQRNVLSSAAVIDVEDNHGLLEMFYDITERKRTEEELKEAIDMVMQDTAWFSQSLLEKLAQVRSGEVDQTDLKELTKRERQVMHLLAKGLSNEAIGAELGVAPQTVRNYISTVYDKINVHSRAEAVVWARERGLAGHY